MIAPVLVAALLIQSPLIVSPAGPFRTIGAAVAAAPAGAIVRVRAGVYREPTITIARPMTLEGEPGAVLDGQGKYEIIVIRAPGVTIRGLRFRNTGHSYHEDRAAVHADSAIGCRIERNRFDETFFAIYLARTEGCAVRDNVIVGKPLGESATGNAIHSWGSRDLIIERNRVSGHRDGLYLEFTRHAVVRNNTSEANIRYGLHFMYADSSAYTENVFRANNGGVAVMYSKVVTMTRNVFRDNRGSTAYGLLLKEIADVHLSQNQFIGNSTGLLADGADRVQVIDNRFTRNGYAIRLLASTTAGQFTGNEFAANSFDVAVNSRLSSTRFWGNWWDSYRGWDLNRDGIGDPPHHPVRLFTLMVDRSPSAGLLQRSLFVRLIDAAERMFPSLTPESVVDKAPLMKSAGDLQ
jgi:nitrous oxidase accessory protein